MASEINKALEEIKDCIEKKENFCLDAGAGSGKTHTLVSTINYLKITKPESKIICITYTNNAKNEIISRLSDVNNIFVSTIHEFIWKNICKFQASLRVEVNKCIIEKISKYEIENNETKVEKYKNADLTLPISYRDYESLINGIISHDTLLNIFNSFLSNEQYCNILFSSIDYIFVDEYQDTHKIIFYEFLKKLQDYKEKFNDILIGLFGDTMQNIYLNGIGEIQGEYKNIFKFIKKEENYRSCSEIINLNNSLRSDLIQVCKNNSVKKNEIKFIYNLSDDKYLKQCIQYNDFEKLHLTHRYIADEVGFSNIYDIYYKRYGNNTSNIIKNADERYLRYICNEIMPLIYETKNNISSAIIKNINKNYINFEILNNIKEQVYNIISEMSEISIQLFLEKIFSLDILSNLDYLKLCKTYEESEDVEFLSIITEIKAIEFYNYYLQFSEKTLLQTMHGTKGNEFKHVVININENTTWNWYNFSKLFKNQAMKESVKNRTEKLLYVSCTRAQSSLIINYIVEENNSRSQYAINLMKNNIERIWGNKIEFVIYE